MTLKKWIAAMLSVCLLASGVAYASGGGTSSDPIATLGYVKTHVVVPFNRKLDESVKAAEPTLRASVADAKEKLSEIKSRKIEYSADSLASAVEYEATMRMLDGGSWRSATEPVTLELQAGEQAIVAVGGEVTLTSGVAEFSGERSGGAVCVSNGLVYFGGLGLRIGERYIVVVENATTGVLAKAPTVLAVRGSYQLVPAMQVRHIDAAMALRSLGLMKGTDKGFELERGATRLEALIMFLRLIGEEEQALAFTGAQPFTDLPNWGGGAPAKYVGYAYSRGYTNGVSEHTFGAYDPVTVEMYTTFILRALGYSEADGDFSWVTAPADAVRLGVFSEYERSSACRRVFCRDTMAYLSWRALEAQDKSGTKLTAKLQDAGVFKPSAYRTAKSSGVRTLAQ